MKVKSALGVTLLIIVATIVAVFSITSQVPSIQQCQPHVGGKDGVENEQNLWAEQVSKPAFRESVAEEQLASNACTSPVVANGDRVIHSGYIFIDGRYEEPPYVLSIEGLSITLNGNVVHCIKRRATKKDAMSSRAIDPEFPAWVSSDTSLEDIMSRSNGKRSIVYDKWDYLRQKYPPREAIEEMLEYLRSLPCIAAAETEMPVPDDSYFIVKITHGDGAVRRHVFPVRGWWLSTECSDSGGPTTGEVKYTKDDVYGVKSIIAHRLLHNGGVFFFRERLSMLWGEESVGKRMPAIMALVTSECSRQDKIDTLRRLGVAVSTEQFLDGFVATQGLTERINRNNQVNDIVPLTLDEARSIPEIEAILGIDETQKK
jgi:hypothetical protein